MNSTVFLSSEIAADLFINKPFTLSRIDGSIIAALVTLREDGTIEGHRHPNEARWTLGGDALMFVNEDGIPTTIFDKLSLGRGTCILSGKFIPRSDVEYYHVLTEHPQIVVPPAPIAIDPTMVATGQADVAVLVRAHRIDEKFYDLMRKLNTNRRGFDLYPIIDETNGRSPIDFSNVVWHSVSACRELGLTQSHQALLWQCGDMPFYFAVRELPDYKHYLMIEYDVDLVRPDATFINQLCDKLQTPDGQGLDFSGFRFNKLNSQSGWYEAVNKVFPDRNCYFAYFPVILVSKKLAVFMFSQRLLEAVRKPEARDVIHCEAFVSTCAMAGGFQCMDLGEFMPGCYEFPFVAMQLGGFGGLGKPIGAKFEFPAGIELLHPIYGYREFLDRVYRKYVIEGKNDWAGLLRVLDGDEAAVVPPELSEDLRAKAVAALHVIED